MMAFEKNRFKTAAGSLLYPVLRFIVFNRFLSRDNVQLSPFRKDVSQNKKSGGFPSAFLYQDKDLPAAAAIALGKSRVEAFVFTLFTVFTAAFVVFDNRLGIREGFNNPDFAAVDITCHTVILEIRINEVVVLVVDADPHFLFRGRLCIGDLAFLGHINRREVRNDGGLQSGVLSNLHDSLALSRVSVNGDNRRRTRRIPADKVTRQTNVAAFGMTRNVRQELVFLITIREVRRAPLILEALFHRRILFLVAGDAGLQVVNIDGIA